MGIDFSKNDYNSGRFGIEREALRVNEDGTLALTPHPAVFGNKLKNPYITTDFSESQVEMITPATVGIHETYVFLSRLYDYTLNHLGKELLWPQSMPCIIPKGIEIPVARYEGKEGKAAVEYRKGLLRKYGGEKQLISGIHYNFSFLDETLLDLQKQWGRQELSLQDFKDEVYLKVARNYLRYGFVVVAALGCSNLVHSSYSDKEHFTQRDQDSYVLKNGISLRSSSYGYQNTELLFPDYTSVENYVKSIEGFVERGSLSQPKELYACVRLKSVTSSWESLKSSGIAYLEIRNIDLNPFTRCGIDEESLQFLHATMLYLLEKEETGFADWQKEGWENRILIAEQGLKKELTLKREGKSIPAKDYLQELFDGIFAVANRAGISIQKERFLENKYLLAQKMLGLPYVQFHMDRARQYKAKADSTVTWQDLTK